VALPKGVRIFLVRRQLTAGDDGESPRLGAGDAAMSPRLASLGRGGGGRRAGVTDTANPPGARAAAAPRAGGRAGRLVAGGSGDNPSAGGGGGMMVDSRTQRVHDVLRAAGALDWGMGGGGVGGRLASTPMFYATSCCRPRLRAAEHRVPLSGIAAKLARKLARRMDDV